MGRHRRLRLHGPAHAPLVRQAVGQADVQPLLRGAAVGGGFRAAGGTAHLKHETHCGRGPARESGGTANIEVADTTPSRAGSLPQGH